MPFPQGYKKVAENRFCCVYREYLHNKTVIKGKRVPNNCPYTKEELRAYITNGPAKMCKLVVARTGLRLSDVWPAIRKYRDYK